MKSKVPSQLKFFVIFLYNISAPNGLIMRKTLFKTKINPENSDFKYFIEILDVKCCVTLSWRRSLSYRNQSTDLLCKSMDWFLYDRDLRHERTKEHPSWNPYLTLITTIVFQIYYRREEKHMYHEIPNVDYQIYWFINSSLLFKNWYHVFFLRENSFSIW